MSRYSPSIKVAFERQTGEVIKAEDVFSNKKDAFAVRKQFHEDKVELYCCECEQKLNVSTSKYDNLHFKHQPNAAYCILKDENLSPGEVDLFNNIHIAKESPRHKELKNKIAAKLLTVDGVEASSIAIDNKFIIRGNDKRRPDVYCRYRDKELVFEIQLSQLSLRYILSRYNFYKTNGIYLIWILDNFDIHSQAQLERDIKYLTKYENFFKLDERYEAFQLDCQYKIPFLTDDNRLLTKWTNQSVTLNQIGFDAESRQIYYYNFGDNKQSKEIEQRKRFEEIRAEEWKRIEEQRQSAAKSKAEEIIEEIKRLRLHKVQVYTTVKRLIYDLDEFEMKAFNSRLNLRGREKPALNQWIGTAKQEDMAFIDFILSCNDIDIDISEADVNGVTAFQEAYRNNEIFRENLIKSLLRRGYSITDSDEAYLNTLPNNRQLENERIIYSLCQKLSNRNLVADVFKHAKLLFIIESARRKEIVGSNLTQWIAFANNTIQYRSEYWEYIEVAFKFYGLWDRLEQSDKKGTFARKLNGLYQNMPLQKFDFDGVFRNLYPEIGYSKSLVF